MKEEIVDSRCRICFELNPQVNSYCDKSENGKHRLEQYSFPGHKGRPGHEGGSLPRGSNVTIVGRNPDEPTTWPPNMKIVGRSPAPEAPGIWRGPTDAQKERFGPGDYPTGYIPEKNPPPDAPRPGQHVKYKGLFIRGFMGKDGMRYWVRDTDKEPAGMGTLYTSPWFGAAKAWIDKNGEHLRGRGANAVLVK